MPAPIVQDQLSLALVNVVLLALWTVLPALLLAYGLLSLTLWRTPPDFSLRRSEAAELNRALSLYESVCGRLKEIDERKPDGFWRGFFARPDADPQRIDERENLTAHARHLGLTIVRLRRLPLQRLKTWVHIVGARFALGHALVVHIEAFALLILALYLHGHAAWAHESRTAAPSPLVWYPFDPRMFFANAAAAGLAALSAPLFYLLRRRCLRREYGLEFCLLKELADSGPDQKIEQPQAGPADGDMSVERNPAAPSPEECWVAVLGVTQPATMEQVREAYRAQIRQNHPDRVHDMSPAIRKCAEAETKKLNAAYRQAIACVS
jgi:hypothetical protein